MRRGVRFGVDFGQSRIGLAKSDPDGILATPFTTLHVDSAAADGLEQAVATVLAACEDAEPLEFVIGLPVSLTGQDTPSTAIAREFALVLSRVTSARVALLDERLSTVSAAKKLRQNGLSAKDQKRTIDQAAATEILQFALESERASGNAPGVAVP